jgi:rhodanese-related sulfurtransferase
LPQRMDEIPAGSTPVFVCAVGGRSMAACRLFAAGQDRDAINLAGGVKGWSSVFGAPPPPHDHAHDH